MLIRKILIVVLACCSLSAAAEIISLAYEVAVSDLRLPTYATGTISFRECESCKTHVVRVSEDTQYVLNDVAIPLGEFAKELNTIVGKEKNIATVMRHLESDTVVALHVYRK